MNKGYVYAMDFGMLDEFHKLLKLGTSLDPEVRCEQHTKNGNKFLRGREGKVLIKVPVSVYNQTRYEDKNRDIFDQTEGMERAHHCRDTYIVDTRIIQEISLTIKKTYTVAVA